MPANTRTTSCSCCSSSTSPTNTATPTTSRRRVTIPKGASFKDMIALKGDSDIGNKINTQVIQPLIDANSRLARSDFPDFNDPNKLGEGAARVERLSNLIAIFQKPELDFSRNRAEYNITAPRCTLSLWFLSNGAGRRLPTARVGLFFEIRGGDEGLR